MGARGRLAFSRNACECEEIVRMGVLFYSRTSEEVLVQQRSEWSGVKRRLRREDCEYVKHDKLFSKWKILVGPSDWSEHSAGKDGIDRYHLHNLPASHFGPGVYELGVTAPSWTPTSHSQRRRSLKREDVLAVYVGQADNIRQRLQQYGQAGSHLEGSGSTKYCRGNDDSVSCGSSSSLRSQSGDQSGVKRSNSSPRLFSEVFALGSSVAFRWAHTDSKVMAEQVESELLAVFDYAWNKGSNGNRRSRDILAKLFMSWPTNDPFCKPVFSGKKFLLCGTNAVGIKVALRKPQDTSSNSNKSMINTNPCFCMQMQSPVPANVLTPGKTASMELRCGVLTDKGISCDVAPVKGRKRCLHHKGMRVRGVPAAGHPPLVKYTIMDDSMGRVKRESVKVGEGSVCLPIGLQSFFSAKTRIDRNKVPEDEPGERRPLSLSFNTWMKVESERVHDGLDSSWSCPNGEVKSSLISLYKASKQDRGQHSGINAIPNRKVRQPSCKYTPVPVDDSKRR